MKKRNFIGFLIELMMVVAVIGVLISVGVPAYNNYIIKTNAASALSFLSRSKSAIAEYYSLNQSFPTSIADAKLEGLSSFSIITEAGVSVNNSLTATSVANATSLIGGAPAGGTLYIVTTDGVEIALTPVPVGVSLNWVCFFSNGNTTLSDENLAAILPTGCTSVTFIEEGDFNKI